MKLKVYKILFALLFIISVILLGCIIREYGTRQITEKENKEVVEIFSQIEPMKNDKSEENMQIEMQGYKVIGIVKIDKIGIKYPILEVERANPEDVKEPIKISIIKYWGGNVNDYGNLSIAGHNYYNGKMFGKTKNLEIGDIIQLTDLNKRTISYEIYKKFRTNPNDVSILRTEDYSTREVTLITCTNGNRERLILKAKEIK